MSARLLQDLTVARRRLLHARGFSTIAILTLALAIGATTVVYSVVHGVLLRPLPLGRPDRLVQIFETARDPSTGQVDESGYFAWGNFADIRDGAPAFSHVTAWQYFDRTLAAASGAERLNGRMVTADFFSTVGVPPLLGRGFRPEDTREGQQRVAVIGHGVWRTAFGSDPGIVGRVVRLDGIPHTVVGVMPPAFDFPYDAELWMPLVPFLGDAGEGLRRFHRYRVAGRLAEGATIERARIELDALARRLESAYPETNTGDRFRAVPLRDAIVGTARPALRVLFGAVIVLLLIGCANIATLLLARAAGRRREVAVRSALGASRRQILRQLLVESLLLAVVGGTMGVALAAFGLDAFVRLAGDMLPRASEVAMRPEILLFAIGVSVATGVLCGLAPALHYSRTDAGELLRGGRGTAGDRGARLIRRALVTGQLAFAVVLVVGAGLLARSFARLTRVDTGVQSENVLSLELSLPSAGYEQPERAHAFYGELLSRIHQLPGVRSAAASLGAPATGFGWGNRLRIEGRSVAERDVPMVGYRVVTPGFFATVGIPVLRGRAFDSRESREPAVIVSRTTAALLWPDADPVGARVRFSDDAPWLTVVGVVGDVPPTPGEPIGLQVYVPPALESLRTMTVLVRAERDPLPLVPEIRAIVRSLDADTPITAVAMLGEQIAVSLLRPRLMSAIVGTFAAIALLLASLGVYGTLAYSVAQRSRELAIRMAVGADARRLQQLVMRDGLRLAAVGVTLGLLGALGAGGLLRSLLFGVGATDPATYLAVVGTVLAAVLVASWVPSRRATRVDPARVLHEE